MTIHEDPLMPIHGNYYAIRGQLYYDTPGHRKHILDFCLDDPEQGAVVELPLCPVPDLREGAQPWRRNRETP